MANRFGRKFLFSIFIADEKGGLASILASLEPLFFDDAKGNAHRLFGQESSPEQLALLEQIGLYYDSQNHRVIITGVANGNGLVEVTEAGQPQLVKAPDSNNELVPKVVELFVAIKDKLGIPGSMCTWVVVPLDELGGGFGTLHIKGMGGVSGTG